MINPTRTCERCKHWSAGKRCQKALGPHYSEKTPPKQGCGRHEFKKQYMEDLAKSLEIVK